MMTNKCQRKPKGQSSMNNPESLVTLTHKTEDENLQKKHRELKR